MIFTLPPDAPSFCCLPEQARATRGGKCALKLSRVLWASEPAGKIPSARGSYKAPDNVAVRLPMQGVLF